jgi:hypothetical protein
MKSWKTLVKTKLIDCGLAELSRRVSSVTSDALCLDIKVKDLTQCEKKVLFEALSVFNDGSYSIDSIVTGPTKPFMFINDASSVKLTR